MKMDFEKAYDSVSWNILDYMLYRMGFNEVWRKWMKACVTAGTISVLVNGSPIEVNAKRGLRQGDPLAPFLFLVVVEGLARLVRSAVEKGVFAGLSVDNFSFPLLHFADDTIVLCKATRANLWAIKTIFRCFELVSGLKVNFSKSCMYGTNYDDQFLCIVAKFLFCRVGKLPFKFQGIPVSANPRRSSTWDPSVSSMMKKLQKWKGRFLGEGLL